MPFSNQCIVIPSPTPQQQQQQRPISRGRSVRRYHSPFSPLRDGRSRSRKRTSPAPTSSDKQQVKQQGQFDNQGYCINHPSIRVAKKKIIGSGYKIYKPCPNCFDCSNEVRTGSTLRCLSVKSGETVPDTLSVCSKSSGTSILSMGSAWSSKSKNSRKEDKCYASPFNTQGYCLIHPSIRLAKKKSLLNGGGWKVIRHVCPDCAIDKAADGASTRSGRSRRSRSSRGRSSSRSGGHSRSSRRSSSGRSSRSSSRSSRARGAGQSNHSDSDSYISGMSSISDMLEGSSKSKSSSRSARKKKTRVKEMRYQDTNGKIGRYTGTVNDDLVPNGEGKMKYKDGSVWCGVWNEGSRVHGKWIKSGGGGDSAVQRENSAGGSCAKQEMNSSVQRKNSSGTQASIQRKVNHQASTQRNQATIQRKSSNCSLEPIRPPNASTISPACKVPPPPPPRPPPRASIGGSGKSEPEHKTSPSSSSGNKPEQKTHTDDNIECAKDQSSNTITNNSSEDDVIVYEEDDIIIQVKHGSDATVVSDMQYSTTSSWLNRQEALSSKSKTNTMNRYKNCMAEMKIGEDVQLPMDEYGNGRKYLESPSVVSDIQDSTTDWLKQIEDYQSKSKTNHIMNSYKEYMKEMKISIIDSSASESMSVESPFMRTVDSKDGTFGRGDLLKWTKAQFLQETEPASSSNGKIKIGGGSGAHVDKLDGS